MDDKYLNDGRKVRVIGKLNNQEMIVQEIFVTNSGDEIPSGESFTAKSLHDEPVLSYKEKEAKRAEERLKHANAKREKAEVEQRKAEQKLKGLREVLTQSHKLVDLFPEQDLEVLTAFMTGTIEYLVVEDYTITPPVKMVDKIIDYDRFGFDAIKLCSFLGRSGGDTEFAINRYSDGSGGWTTVHPFTNYDDALSHIRTRAESLIEHERLSEKSYLACVDMGIEFSDEYGDKYRKTRSAEAEKGILKQREEIQKAQEKIEKLSKSLV